MNKFFGIFLIFFLISTKIHAGWIIAQDALNVGVAKVSHNSGNYIVIEVCPYLHAKRCSTYSIVSTIEEFNSKVKNFIEVVAAGGAHIFFGMTTLLVPEATTFIARTGLTVFSIGGEYVIPMIKATNIIRQIDFLNVYSDHFIKSDDSIISFPDDNLSEVLAEI